MILRSMRKRSFSSKQWIERGSSTDSDPDSAMTFRHQRLTFKPPSGMECAKCTIPNRQRAHCARAHVYRFVASMQQRRSRLYRIQTRATFLAHRSSAYRSWQQCMRFVALLTRKNRAISVIKRDALIINIEQPSPLFTNRLR